VRNKRVLALTLSLVVAGTIAGTAIARTNPGSISLSGSDAVNHSGAIDWTWRSGSYVKSSSRISLQQLSDGAWQTFAAGIAITRGSYTWDTTATPDGDYAVRAIVDRTTVRSGSLPFTVDHTAPEVRITRPSSGDVIVDDEQRAAFAVVVGRTTLVSDARDGGTDIASVVWSLDGIDIANGMTAVYDFSVAKPGQHTLTATATDGAGNMSEVSITVVSAPGSSALDAVPRPDPSSLPSPDPSNPPTVPAAGTPTPPAVPTPGAPTPPAVPAPGTPTPPAVPPSP